MCAPCEKWRAGAAQRRPKDIHGWQNKTQSFDLGNPYVDCRGDLFHFVINHGLTHFVQTLYKLRAGNVTAVPVM